MLPKALKSCPKSNKSPNLVTLSKAGKVTKLLECLPTTTILLPALLGAGHKTIYDKSVDGVPRTRTRGSRVVGLDKSTELWRHPNV